MMSRRTPDQKLAAEVRLRAYDREMLRAAFVSLLWPAYERKREREGITLTALADALGIDKSAVSRWFATRPNWIIDTIADVARCLDLDLAIEARDRVTVRVYTPAGAKQTRAMPAGKTRKELQGHEA